MAEAKMNSKIEVDIKVNIQLSLAEAKALLEITKYGYKDFLKVFYDKLGKVYLKPHEDGIISLFETIKTSLNDSIIEADVINNAINNIKK